MNFLEHFSRCSDLKEIFNYISTLPTTTDKGNAFEYFAQEFFKHDERTNPFVKNVWGYSDKNGIPTNILEKLKLPEKDMGIDLIIETYKSKYWFVQVKFRSDPSASLGWTKDHLSTFESLAFRKKILNDDIEKLILFANVYDCPEHYKTHELLSTFLYDDIITSENLLSYLHDYNNTEVPKIIKHPRPYQKDIIDNIETFYQNNNCGKMVMPCGAGKTITSVWIMKKIMNGYKAPHVIVIIPTLDLIAQYMRTFLQEYAYFDNKLWNILVVASRISGDLKESHSFSLNTDEYGWSKFYEESLDQPKIVFATFASAPIFHKYLVECKYYCDLAIIDEAHLSAGANHKELNDLLHDKETFTYNLYMTATEKIFGKQCSNLYNCMSDENIYGQYISNIGFRELYNYGKENGQQYLCDYEVKMMLGLTKHYDARQKIVVKTSTGENSHIITQSDIASMAMIKKCFDKGEVSHVIAYSTYVRDSKKLVQIAKDIFKNNDVKLFHINGCQSPTTRRKLLEEYQTSNKAIIFNARILRFGIDLPITNGICFCSDTTDSIEIIQMVMRGSRPYSGKKDFKIIIPCPVDDEEKLLSEDMDFKTVRRVICSLSESDPEFKCEWNCKYGGNKTSYMGKQRIYISVEETFDQETIDEWIRCFELCSLNSYKISQLNWEKKYNLTKEYIEKNNAYPECRYKTDDGVQIGNWATDNKKLFLENKLDTYRHEKMLKLLPYMKTLDDTWYVHYESLHRFYKEHDKLPKPSDKYEEFGLGNWLNKQRGYFRSGKLPEDKQLLLEEFEFLFWTDEEEWEFNYEVVRQYIKKYKIKPTPKYQYKNYRTPGFHNRWCKTQKSKYEKGALNACKLKMIESIDGWYWSEQDKNWSKYYNEFAKLKRLPTKSDENQQLYIWMCNQRQRKNDLSKSRIEKLEKLPCWEWHKDHHKDWLENYHDLKNFVEKNNKYPSTRDNYILYKWTSRQRHRHKNHLIKPEEILLMESLPNWVWDYADNNMKIWQEHFNETIEYVNKYGELPKKGNNHGGSSINTWCKRQRTKGRSGNLTDEQKKLLESIDGWYWGMSRNNPDESQSVEDKLRDIIDGKISDRQVKSVDIKQFMDDNNISRKGLRNKTQFLEKIKEYFELA